MNNYSADHLALVIGGAAVAIYVLGVRACDYGCAEDKRSMQEQQYQLQPTDLNNNEVPNQFSTIDDKLAAAGFDGRPVSELYLRRSSE